MGRGSATPGLSVVLFGTGDLEAPRARLLLSALKGMGGDVRECRIDIWKGLHDKSLVSPSALLRRLATFLLGCPGLIARYLRQPRHDYVLVLHPGWLDVLLVWPFAKARRATIVWDAFLPLHETLVEDRRIVPGGSFLAGFLTLLEWLTCHASDRLIVDTSAHAAYIQERYGVPGSRVRRVFVAAEPQFFDRPSAAAGDVRPGFLALFYGRFTPLQGVGVIVEAARILSESEEDITFVLVGDGQEAGSIDRRLRELDLPNVRRVTWVDYEDLAGWIGRADVCLGIFGVTGKSERVIPYKVFQAVAGCRPIVTRDSPAIRELLRECRAVRLIPAGDPQALASALLLLRSTPAKNLRRDTERYPAVGLDLVAEQLRDALEDHAATGERVVSRTGQEGA